MKKAYIISLVILLLFGSVVPCFALPYSTTVNIPLQTFDYTSGFTSVSAGSLSYSDGNVFFKKLSSSQYTSGIYFNQSLTLNHFYYCVVDYEVFSSSEGSFGFLYKYRTAMNGTVGTHRTVFTVSPTDRLNLGLFQPNSYMVCDVSISYFCVIDVTEHFDTLPSVSEVDDFFASYDFDPTDLQQGSYTLTLPSDFSPFLGFYSNLFHSFDYFPDLVTDKLYMPFIFISGIIAILIVIFVVVFLFKRFTGGKS